MKAKAFCIGHAAWDLCMHVDAYPAENSKGETDLLVESSGGPAANAAWLLAHWGVPTALAAVIGRDRYGRCALNELRDAGVNSELVEQRPSLSTPVSFIVVNRANGSRTIINRKTPAALLKLSRRKLRRIEPALLLFDGHESEASLAAMKAFPSAVTVLDAGSLRKGTEVLAPEVRYLVCSEKFAAQVTGETNILANWQRCLRRFRKLNDNVVVITLGANGSVFDDGENQGRMPALPVKAIDTTAAGDVFHGAFAFALLRNMSLVEALRLATVAAGLSVQKAGGRTSFPELKAVLGRVAQLSTPGQGTRPTIACRPRAPTRRRSASHKNNPRA